MITEFNEKGYPMVFSDESVNTQQLKDKCIKAIESLSGVHGEAERKAQACFMIALSELENNWKQRAEAAEAALERESDIHIDTAASMREWRLRAEAAETQLAELAKQAPEAVKRRALKVVAAVGLDSLGKYKSGFFRPEHVSTADVQIMAEYFLKVIDLNTAAPAAVPVDWVPDELTTKQASRSYGGEVAGYHDGWNACRSEMLRRIADNKK